MDTENTLSKARKESSSAIGYITSLATYLVTESAQEYRKNVLFPFVAKQLPNVHMRTQKYYTLVLLAAKLLCERAKDIVTYHDIIEYFVNKWAPVVNELHSTSYGLLKEFLNEVVGITTTLPTYEVLQMIISRSGTRKGDVMISLYMLLLMSHVSEDMQHSIDDIKRMTVELGGRRNVSCRFLQRGCRDTECKSSNTVVCKGVLQIPRLPEFSKLSATLDKACYPKEFQDKDLPTPASPSSVGDVDISDVLTSEMDGITIVARTEEHSQSDSDDSSSTNTEVAFSRRSKILPARKHVSSVSDEGDEEDSEVNLSEQVQALKLLKPVARRPRTKKQTRRTTKYTKRTPKPSRKNTKTSKRTIATPRSRPKRKTTNFKRYIKLY
ncbi:uncharacterized protein [Dysidea avara]|uniref:uncharacterized protein isoform X2 n=1 Tax=Dysidea avara TaxID=196820 RepID=UPI00332F1E95